MAHETTFEMGNETTQVLVVDDDNAIREMLRTALEAEGYAVRVLAGGREVIETLHGMRAPCVVLMDLMMPGVSGWDVCESLRTDTQLARHPLVVMTAGLMKGDACPPPARMLLCKPFDLNQVYALVASLASEADQPTLCDSLTDYDSAASVA